MYDKSPSHQAMVFIYMPGYLNRPQSMLFWKLLLPRGIFYEDQHGQLVMAWFALVEL